MVIRRDMLAALQARVQPSNAEVESPTLPVPAEGAEPAELLARLIAEAFVRRKNSYYDVHNPSIEYGQDDVQRIALLQFRAAYPNTELTQQAVAEGFKRAITEKSDCTEQSIRVWDGREVLRPDIPGKLVEQNGTVSINSWTKPRYREVNFRGGLTRSLELFLDMMMPRPEDRELFMDWLAANLQNEADKPTYSIFLYSKEKGTGKSTLCELCARLFGRENSMHVSGLGPVTGRFTQPILKKKFLVIEEVKATRGSSAGNALKTLITEPTMSSESKGKDIQPFEQRLAVMLTSNHLPTWIEPNDRRFLVINVDHDGSVHGPRATEFQHRVAWVRRQMEKDFWLEAMYRGLLKRRLADGFSIKAIPTSALNSPIMEQIVGVSEDIQLARLAEHLEEQGLNGIAEADLVQYAQETLKVNPQRISHWMAELGWAKAKGKFGGKDYQRVVWLRPGYSLYRGKIVGPDGYSAAVSTNEDEFEIVEPIGIEGHEGSGEGSI